VDTTHSKATTAAVTSRNYSTTQYQRATTINTTVDGFLMQQPHSSNTVDYIKCPVMLLCGSCTIIRTQLIIIIINVVKSSDVSTVLPVIRNVITPIERRDHTQIIN